MSDDSPTPETTDPVPPEAVAPQPDPLDVHIAALDDRALDLLQLPPDALSMVASAAVGRARAAPDARWRSRLQALRGVTLQANLRPAHALVLAGLADVAHALGDQATRVDALEHRAGVFDLLGERVKAHRGLIELASAQALSQPAAAERTLMKAADRARAMEKRGDRLEGVVCLHLTMLALGRLMADQARLDEARIWLEGALDLAPDADSRQAAETALLAIDAG